MLRTIFEMRMLQAHVCYMPLEQYAFQLWSWSIFDFKNSSRLLMVQNHMVISWGQNLKKADWAKVISVILKVPKTHLFVCTDTLLAMSSMGEYKERQTDLRIWDEGNKGHVHTLNCHWGCAVCSGSIKGGRNEGPLPPSAPPPPVRRKKGKNQPYFSNFWIFAPQFPLPKKFLVFPLAV